MVMIDKLMIRDFVKHTWISIVIFLVTIGIAWLSDVWLHLSGVVLVIVASVISFVGRFVLLKVSRFNKEVEECC